MLPWAESLTDVANAPAMLSFIAARLEIAIYHLEKSPRILQAHGPCPWWGAMLLAQRSRVLVFSVEFKGQFVALYGKGRVIFPRKGTSRPVTSITIDGSVCANFASKVLVVILSLLDNRKADSK